MNDRHPSQHIHIQQKQNSEQCIIDFSFLLLLSPRVRRSMHGGSSFFSYCHNRPVREVRVKERAPSSPSKLLGQLECNLGTEVYGVGVGKTFGRQHTKPLQQSLALTFHCGCPRCQLPFYSPQIRLGSFKRSEGPSELSSPLVIPRGTVSNEQFLFAVNTPPFRVYASLNIGAWEGPPSIQFSCVCLLLWATLRGQGVGHQVSDKTQEQWLRGRGGEC